MMVEIIKFQESTDWPSYLRSKVAVDPDPAIQSLLRRMQGGDEGAGRDLMKVVIAREFNGKYYSGLVVSAYSISFFDYMVLDLKKWPLLWCHLLGLDLHRLYNNAMMAEAREKLLENQDLLRLVGDEQAVEILRNLKDPQGF